MNYTQEQLEQVEKFASIYLPISDIALLMDMPAEVLREEPFTTAKDQMEMNVYVMATGCGMINQRVEIFRF